MSAKKQIEETISALKQQRDELALQIHLGAMEAKNEFSEAKEKLDRLSDEFEPLKSAVGESAENVYTALELLGQEVLSSFSRIRRSLSE